MNMTQTSTTITVYELLAHLIDYPSAHLPTQVRECAAALKMQRSRAARPIGYFRLFVEQVTLNDLEELYAATFDLKPVCYPYIGYQLFGDTYKRGEFLARLNARYRESGFVVQGELPDHLGMILRYLARTWDADLVTEGMIPSLERMIEQLEGNPYRDLLRAILAVLREQG
ncbi:nitrate reductase molybdenum cofactor assembly chaperone [Aggregatilinea lenta]|uniref:nitrate reductase molybdenum cofactor assembly chaperone n=1 Tax=Aggregatilinea lenta TaxID=913108 RepID=UPI000E5A352B|nr:nitrate reductase molybdenum cofactor assembly chaperone [Aggregatilinea lenta]